MNLMHEIAYTAFGKNALFAGLISHSTAVLIAMMPASGATFFFGIIFPLSCLLLATGSYAEMKQRDCHPLKDKRFYGAVAATLLPLLGLLIVLVILYSIREIGQKADGISGFFPAVLRLKADALVIFILLIVLFLLFAVIHSNEDPYFRKRLRSDPEAPVNTVISASVAYPSRIAE